MLPPLFIIIYTGLILVLGAFNESMYEGLLEKADNQKHAVNILNKVLGYLTLTTNLISCAVLLLAIRQAYQITRKTV